MGEGLSKEASPIYPKILLIHDIAYVLIQQRGKRYSREEKSSVLQCFFAVYARSLKDQVRKSERLCTWI